MYTRELIWIISWPLLIYVAFKMSLFFVDKYEKRMKKEGKGDKK